MKRIFLILIASCFLANNSKADNHEELNKIEDYLNNIKNLSADFIQTDSNGNSAEGKLYIKKPNKINMQYSDDMNVELIGDGKYVVYHDKDLGQVTHISYSDIPATLILANDIKIDGKDLIASDFRKDNSSTSVTFKYEKSDNVGPITLIFTNSPFELKQWKIVDPKGIEITLSLYNIKRDIKLDNKLFKFKDKKFDPLSN